MSEVNPQIEESWLEALKEEFSSDYFISLKQFLKEEKKKYTIFPPGNEMFTAFNLCPLSLVKVVIIGQDPYHGAEQAHGLCFSVQKGIQSPPSLKNIFKEVRDDLDIIMSDSGDLSPWAKQGALLINATLTVLATQAGSHQKKGWEEFTDSVIKTISDKKENVVFLLWGSYAQGKEVLIDSQKHLILKAPHPSPLSSYRGFFGCKHFSQTNKYLKDTKQEEIDWTI